MILRTYGRRNRGIGRTFSDSMDDDVLDPYRDSPSSQGPQDLFAFSSQDSTTLNLPYFDTDHFDTVLDAGNCTDGGGPRKAKKRRNGDERGLVDYSVLPVTSTLMETQEFGEMMEHVDEVNFALDGLRKGQPVRIRRASLLSLLGICSTAQQRRLLRTHGMAKTITDALMRLNFDDSPSNLAAATLFYLLISDGQDDQLLESSSCIHFLVKMLKPIASTTAEDKVSHFGFKLSGLRKDAEHGLMNKNDISSTNIILRVKEILTSCKELKSNISHAGGVNRYDLSPKWIALLTMEKASLSTISLEESSGIVRKTGGNFKEKMREFGGLDAVFEVSTDCYSIMEGWRHQRSPPLWEAKDDMYLRSLMLLLKCLKIMENATFLSKDNQIHLLEMRGNLASGGAHLSFTKLVISLIEILSDLYLLKSCPPASNCGKSGSQNSMDQISELAFVAQEKEKSNEIFVAISSTQSSMEGTSSKKCSGASQHSEGLLSVPPRYSSSTSGMTSSSNGSNLLKIRFGASASASRGGLLKSSTSGTSSNSNGFRSNFSNSRSHTVTEDTAFELSDNSQDPFAFDEYEFEPSKWEVLSGKKKSSRSKNRKLPVRDIDDLCQQQLKRLEDIDNGECARQELSSWDNNCSQEASTSGVIEEENLTFLNDCLLTAVKVLMNLTNDNPLGCKQIAASGGLETMASLIAKHFPTFSSSSASLHDRKEKNSIELDHDRDKDLTDQELDFLVAILGLLVNLVEKDGRNRARLAATNVVVPHSGGSRSGKCTNVIPLLCSIFLANRGAGETANEEKPFTWDDEAALLQGEKEAEKMIVEAYSALLLAFLSTESKSIRDAIAAYLPHHNLAILVPVLERFVAFHLTLDMMTPETHKAVSEVIESCRIP